MVKNRSQTSFIEDTEEEEAKKLIEEELGFSIPKAFSKKIIVKVYIRPEEASTFKTNDGKTKSIYLPLVSLANDKYSNYTALVLSIAEDCYNGEEYKDSGPGCKVGDWVLIPRNVGRQYEYRGVTVQVVPEDAPFEVVEDPSYVERLYKGEC
jgi:hypothetical protein